MTQRFFLAILNAYAAPTADQYINRCASTALVQVSDTGTITGTYQQHQPGVIVVAVMAQAACKIKRSTML